MSTSTPSVPRTGNLNMDIFNVQCSTLLDLNYQIKEDSGLFIAKTTNEVTQHYLPQTEKHGRLNLKGLIMSESESEISLVAPGCNVPLEQPADCDIKGYSISRDGILYRFYYHNNGWQFSTTGSISCNKCWGPKGTPTLFQLMVPALELGLVNLEKLVPGYCYYAVLESPDFTNLVKHYQLKLTLVDIIDCTTPKLRHVPLDDDTAFSMHEQLFSDPPITGSLPDIGYTIHYSDWSTYRVDTEDYKRALALRPNVPDPAMQWVLLAKSELDGSEGRREFISLFPWHQPLFESCDNKLRDLIEVLTKNYLRIIKRGWDNAEARGRMVPPRHTAYMRKLVDEVKVKAKADEDADIQTEIYGHLMKEDAARIFYLVNPYNPRGLGHGWIVRDMTAPVL